MEIGILKIWCCFKIRILYVYAHQTVTPPPPPQPGQLSGGVLYPFSTFQSLFKLP